MLILRYERATSIPPQLLRALCSVLRQLHYMSRQLSRLHNIRNPYSIELVPRPIFAQLNIRAASTQSVISKPSTDMFISVPELALSSTTAPTPVIRVMVQVLRLSMSRVGVRRALFVYRHASSLLPRLFRSAYRLRRLLMSRREVRRALFSYRQISTLLAR